MKIKTATALGPTMVIPVTPELVITVIDALNEIAVREQRDSYREVIDKPFGPTDELLVGLYNAFTQPIEEDKQKTKKND